MSKPVVRKSIRISQELSDDLDREAEAAGKPVAAYLVDLIKQRNTGAEKAETSVVQTLADTLLTVTANPTFGEETVLQRIDRRSAQSALLIMQLLQASFDEKTVDAMIDMAESDALEARRLTG